MSPAKALLLPALFLVIPPVDAQIAATANLSLTSTASQMELGNLGPPIQIDIPKPSAPIQLEQPSPRLATMPPQSKAVWASPEGTWSVSGSGLQCMLLSKTIEANTPSLSPCAGMP